tara:strand:- start:376 stop:804 length:429 start_codon:yes stop_codon:yes gene_type:complete
MTQALTLLDLETRRCKDFWYGVFFNDTIRDNVFSTTMEIVAKNMKDWSISNRLNMTMMRLKCKKPDNLVKHFLIFFAIDQEPEVQDYVLCTVRDEARKKEVKQFINTRLREITERLLNGRLSSLVHYVDEVRFEVSVNLGFD